MMGAAFRGGGPPRLVFSWCVLALVLVVICQNVDQVAAKFKVDADLVFPQAEDHERSVADPNSEEHWLTHTVNRIRRSIGSFFTNEEGVRPRRNAKTKIRKPRQNQQSVDDEDDEYDDNVDDDEYSGGDEFNQDGDVRIINHSAQFNQTSNYDGDNDDATSGSGDPDDSNELDLPEYIPKGEPTCANYRISLTLHEAYVDAFSDRNSELFQHLSQTITSAIDALYRGVPGYQSSTLIKIEPRVGDRFKLKVTVDLGSEQFKNKDVVRDTLEEHIYQRHQLGGYTVLSDDFQFLVFEAKCRCSDINEMRCKNDQCVNEEARCNGTFECEDHSDEVGCGEITNQSTTTTSTTTTTSPTTTSTDANLIDEGSGGSEPDERPPNCDELVRCKDDSRLICAEHFCDGKEDCDDGSDEQNCPPAPRHECMVGEFACDVKRCIPESRRCDQFRDCDDNTDEQGCSPPPTAQCHPEEFKCSDGKCLHPTQRCDNRRDCSDGLDEANCVGVIDTTVRCNSDQFTCANGYCIAQALKCNRRSDCPDGSDEHNCPCGPTEFQCRNGFCIPLKQRCNAVHNCQDGSDEQNCPRKGDKCESYQWQCADGQCIPQEHRCNLRRECTDGSDEIQCQVCDADEFRCNNGTCISLGRKCDGVSDCGFSEDEENCVNCGLHEFKCTNGDCIDERKRCDRQRDCSDGSDEIDCNGRTLICRPGTRPCLDKRKCIKVSSFCDRVQDCEDYSDERNCNVPPNLAIKELCRESALRCADGTCMPGKRCDSVFDCSDRSDELNCELSCRNDQFRCADGTCIPQGWRCDGREQCPDGSDEHDQSCACNKDQFMCKDGSKCIENTFVCDTFYGDCPDDSDELDCPKTNDTCPQEKFRCVDDSNCIDKSEICDGNPQCTDASDEYDCPKCKLHEFECQNGDCIPDYLRCDKTEQCNDGSDERGCQTCTEPDWFQCSDGTCVEVGLRCDNFYDCRDFSDEQNCFACHPSEFRCVWNDMCIASHLVCNGRYDCSDRSDEQNCPTEPPFILERPKLPPPVSCPPHLTPCDNGVKCIEPAQRCDGRADCHDLSDETECYASNDRLQLKTYPETQDIKEDRDRPDREVVFQCRDESTIRAPIRWVRPNGQPLPPGSVVNNRGRLTIPNIKVEHSGVYYCEAVGFPANTPGARVAATLQVEPDIRPLPPLRAPTACPYGQATCSNGDCIPQNKTCDGIFDCTDGSDENRCNPNGCEPNEFSCANKKCILKTWRCDSENDCGDGSDEIECALNDPGSPCGYHQFACHGGNQCIPRSFHCDQSSDCPDGSDEIGCSEPAILRYPPPMVVLSVGESFTITCSALGVPVPEINWRRNWGHIPRKCTTTSHNGVGTLTCPDIQVEDQGAYSCEAINLKKITFAVPDTILIVNQTSICPAGYFNEDATRPEECIKCFCFGQSTTCQSASLFIYNFQPPFEALKLLGVRINEREGEIEIRDEPIFSQQEQLGYVGVNGVHASTTVEPNAPNLVPYFAMPENYHGNQLNSYGGYLRFRVAVPNGDFPVFGPTVIVTGNGVTLMSQALFQPRSGSNELYQIRFFEGEWLTIVPRRDPSRSSREEIMMALANVDNILIKLQYFHGVLNTTIEGIELESAASPNRGLGPANFVEKCQCPVGYSGASCEFCDKNYVRHKSGPWLGRCTDQPAEPCPPGTYGEPSRGRPCEPCPCPLTNPARTCSLGPDGQVTCDCPQGYVGRRCEACGPGFVGNPLQPGDSCRPYAPPTPSDCHPAGSLSPVREPNGVCRCKQFAVGPTCDSCKASTFFLSTANQFGCIDCFCMGKTRQCDSSTWYRDNIQSVFVSSANNFTLVNTQEPNRPISDGVILDKGRAEISFSRFANNYVHYWKLPARYLGDKVTAYGGHLAYTVRSVPTPGGQSSRNSAPHVELRSSNKINLLYHARDQPPPTGSPQTFDVPLLEQYWETNRGEKVNRPLFLMALADLNDILIKATYYTNTQEAALLSVSLDVASERNTGSERRALEVEECRCPRGYKGLSCEDCDAGYTRNDNGIYLGDCEPCSCNGHSQECDPELGTCHRCAHNTAGEYCDICLPGYVGDPTQGEACVPERGGGECPICNPAGVVSPNCQGGQCPCKANVEGADCGRCKEHTYGLSASNPDGCTPCYCSGITNECSESNWWFDRIPSQIIDANSHGPTLTDPERINQKNKTNYLINPSLNEIGYRFRPSDKGQWYWSLPGAFTGNKITSFGGKLEFVQRYTERPSSGYFRSKDVIIEGNGITVYWSHPQPLRPDTPIRVSVLLTPEGWQRLDQYVGARPATREDLMRALADVRAILIRAQLSSDTEGSYISDIELDTAVNNYELGASAVGVELCRCPPGYQGTSCETCSIGYYKDRNDLISMAGSCTPCPCSGNEQGCHLQDNRVVCSCRPEFTGDRCQYPSDGRTTTEPPRGGQPGPVEIRVTVTSPQLEIYQIGSTLRLNCSAVSLLGRYVTGIYWTRDNTALPHRAIDDNHGLLVITNLQESDSGRYICIASDGYTNVEQDVTVNVGPSTPSRPRVTVSNPYVDAKEGNPIQFQCAASGNPQPNLRIIRLNGQPLNPQHSFVNGALRILSVQLSDSGTYQCIAENVAGTGTANVEVVVTDSNPVETIRVYITPREYTGYASETITLRCIADNGGRGPPRLTWTLNNAALPYNARESGDTLTIQQAKPEDSGIYRCLATSPDGATGTSNVEVTVSERYGSAPPTVVVRPDKSKITQGGSIDILCEASGQPTPTVKWTKRGQELPARAQQIGGVLRITNAQVEDRGYYICVTSNSNGITESYALLDVERLEAPRISIYPKSSITVSEGQSEMVQCHIEHGDPLPTLAWERSDGAQLGPRVEQMSRGELRFNQITLEEAGQYTCVATNPAGNVTAVANIQVHTRPHITLTPNEEILYAKYNSYVRLECRGSGTPLPNVEWRKQDDNTIQQPHSDVLNAHRTNNVAVLEIARFQQADEGLYVCEAANDAGVAVKRVQVVPESVPSRGDITGGNRNRDGGDPTEGEYNPGLRTGDDGRRERYTALEGSRAEIGCQGENSSEETVDWKRTNNASLPYNAYSRNGRLIFDNVQPEAAGEYLCRITHRDGRYTTRIAQLEVIMPPRITLSPKSQAVPPGANAHVECIATGQQPITITWSPEGRQFPYSVTSQEGHLRFTNIQLSDAGRYRCTAQNSAGEADAVAEVIVQEKTITRTLTAENRRQVVQIDSPLDLICHAGNSQDRGLIRWFRQNLPLPQNSAVNGEYLRIFNVQQQDQGRYFCEIQTDVGSVSDYIDVQVTSQGRYCSNMEWTCQNQQCIHQLRRCDGYSDCEDKSDEINCPTRIRRGPITVVKALPPSLHIQPPEGSTRVGDELEITCQSSDASVTPSWTKVSSRVADNVRTTGGHLKIYDARTENSGTYRCEANGPAGFYYKDYIVNVVGYDDEFQDEAPLQTKEVPQGASIILECKTDLPEPVGYVWSKQGGNIASYVDVYQRNLQLEAVSSSEAGIYTCTASNNVRKLEIPTVLIVTGIVPHFSQAPLSFLALDTLPDANIQFNFEISFKPQNSDGLILYNGNKGSERNGDFISLAIVNAIPEFRLNLGQGVTIVRAENPVDLNKWHTIKVTRLRKKATMYVDGEGPFISNAGGKYIGLDLSEPLYLGGVPDFGQISPDVSVYSGFVGCISRFKIGYNYLDITKQALEKHGITTCETCSERKCENRGVCQEALTPEGYSCICPARFSGATCTKLKGEACSPNSCGTGRCVDTENGFDCYCPLGLAGARCEKQISINEPAFRDGSYIAYPTPKSPRKIKVSLRIKPTSTDDGVILYCAETDEGHGDYVSLAIKNRRVVFGFNVGGKTTEIASPDEVHVGESLIVTVSKNSSDSRLIVNGHSASGGRSWNHKVLNLITPLYIGGFDQQNVRINNGVGVNRGFNGCIGDINVSEMELELISSAQDAANVEECSMMDEINEVDNSINTQFVPETVTHVPAIFDWKRTGCSNNPCRNDATCSPLSPVEYKCICIHGYTGTNCEIAPNLCEYLVPCQNGGTCMGNTTKYTCECLLGFIGLNCEERAQLGSDVRFEGNGYLEFNQSLLDPRRDDVIALDISTNASNGLIFWHGQTPNEGGQGKDYIALGLVNGYLEFSFDLGSGPAIIRNQIRVNDGNRHTVILKRSERIGSIEVDREEKRGEANGDATVKNCDGNIYLGGAPSIELMTGGQFSKGFVGCIHGFELQDTRGLAHAIAGINAKPCSSFWR